MRIDQEANNQSRAGGPTPRLRDGDVVRPAYWDDPWRDGQDQFADGGEHGFQFWDAIKTLSRWRWLILAIALCGVIAGVYVIMQATPLYRASTTIEVRRQETQILEGMSVEPAIVADAEFMATQYTLMKSRSLAERVAEKLDLVSDSRYADETASRSERVLQATQEVRDNLSASIVGRSRIIEINFVSPHPSEAARIANAVADGFIEAALERKYNATAYARNFIDGRLQAAKAALEESEQRFVAYAAEKGIIDLTNAGGSSIGSSLDATSLAALNQQFSDAQSRRIALEIKLKGVNQADQRSALESRPLDDLARQRAGLVTEYNEKLFTFQPDFPEMVKLQSQIDAIDREAETERNRIINGIAAEYRTALNTERSIRDRIEDLKGSLQDLRNQSIDYSILKRDVDTNRTQYEALLQRLKEISIADGVGTSQIAIVDRAQPPAAPFEPNKKRILIQFVVLSLALGIGLAFALEYIDDTIKAPEDFAEKLSIPSIGAVPMAKSDDPVAELLENSGSPIGEALSSMRIALQFSTQSGVPKSILVTSVRSAEGKTNTCAALGVALARVGKKVLIIDADMRKPSFAVGAGASKGILGVLAENCDLRSQIVKGATPNLFLLPCTAPVPNPAEVLANPKLQAVVRQARDVFDVVIIDSPPVLGFADAPTLSSICDATLLVLQAGAIRRPAAQRAIERLLAAQANIIGGVLTKYKPNRHGYGYNYSSTYSYGDGPNTAKEKKKRRRKVALFADKSDRTKQAV